MQMKLVDVEYFFDRSKVVFYFTADGRVDFRELVKDLAARLRTRIEMRQIGVRDEAKMVGGFGTCGQEFCCKAFVREFEPVSIKMAKQQDLTLNPAKISGACGRLMCCLSYENTTYSCFKKGLPKRGKTLMTPDGPARVVSHNVLKGSITIHTKDGRQVSIVEPQLSRLRKGLPLEALPEEPEKEQAFSKHLPRKPAAAPETPPRREAPAPVSRKASGDGLPEEKKEGLLSKLKKITGVEKAPEETKKKRKRRRRRRPRSRGKSSQASSSAGSEKKKE
jgi:hypothetical protein